MTVLFWGLVVVLLESGRCVGRQRVQWFVVVWFVGVWLIGVWVVGVWAIVLWVVVVWVVLLMSSVLCSIGWRGSDAISVWM